MRAVGDKVQTVKVRDHFRKGTIVEVDDIGIGGEPYYRLAESDYSPSRWQSASEITDETDEECSCYHCEHVIRPMIQRKEN